MEGCPAFRFRLQSLQRWQSDRNLATQANSCSICQETRSIFIPWLGCIEPLLVKGAIVVVPSIGVASGTTGQVNPLDFNTGM